MNLARNSATGRGPSATLVVSLFGLLIALVIFLIILLRKASAAPQPSKITQRIIDDLVKAGYSKRMGEMVAAISDHETGTWTSTPFKTGNNAFGMGVPIFRKSLKNGTMVADNGRELSTYADVPTSIQDFILYLAALKYAKDYTSVETLITQMKLNGYFKDTFEVYLASVKKRLAKIQSFQGGGASGGW